ncbi:MAG: HEPN domain-containing protein [Candidatus Aenigmatarchaeota archaeon]
MNENLFNVLKQLALSVKRIIDENISKGTIKSEEFPFFRLKVNKFQYTDKGIIELSGHREYITKPSWLRVIHKLMESIKESNEYSSTLEQLTRAFTKNDKLSQALEYFLEKLIHEYLYTQKFEESNIDALIKTFLKDLHEEPVKCGAKVELNGISLVPSEIILSPGITLRQTKIEDLEKESPAYISPYAFPLPPSAILNIEFLGRGANEIQKRVERSIVILRLFKVGSIKWIRYHMYSDSITDLTAHATITSGEIRETLETYSVTEEDVPKLKKFWQVINDAIPPSFFELGITKIDHLTVAYNRYSDCLFQNGILERRIANAVMGLEALFLKSNEAQELIYRLSFRTSKLLSLLGHDPYEVKKIVSDAYKIRNLFVHGGHLSYEKRRKIKSKYGDIRNFLRALLNYLRITIIVMMLSNREKDEFIDLIDNSFIDKRSEEMLNSIISKAKNIL